MVKFEKRGKLELRYIEPFKILERMGIVAYSIDITIELIR